MSREAITCEGDGSRVRMRRGPLCLDYDLRTGRYAIAHGDDCVIEQAEAAFVADGRTVVTSASTPHCWRIESPTGPLRPGTRLVIEPAETNDHVRWSLAFSCYEKFDAIAISGTIENADDEEFELREVRPLTTSEQGHVRFGRALQMTRLLPNAWERNSGDIRVQTIEPGFVCESPVSFVMVDTSGETALAAGALGPAKSFASFRIELAKPKPPTYRLQAIQATPIGYAQTSGVTVPPRARFAPEPIILVFGQSGHEAFEHYAECTGRAAQAPKRAVPCGWSSWPYYRGNVSETEVLRNVEFLQKTLQPYGLETILIDAGWQVRGNVSGGPWRAGHAFPHGMPWLAQQIRERGFRPALWIRPLEVDGLRLDPSSAFTHTTLRNQVRRLVKESGFDGLKIAFLHDDAFHRDDSFLPDEATITAVEALRRTVAAIREGVGETAFLSASHLTLGAGLGLVDSNRIGEDIAADDWRLIKAHGVKGLAARYALHGRWWSNDPDCVVARAPLTVGQARAWASLCALAGGMVMAGDRMYALPAQRLEVLKRVMPAYGGSARPVDLFERDHPEMWNLPVKVAAQRWNVIGLFNWETTPQEIKKTRARIVEENVQRLRANDAIESRRRARATLERIASTNRLIHDEHRRLERLMADDAFGHRPFQLLEPLRPIRASSRFKNIMLHFDRLGLEPAQRYLVYDFWDNRFLGLHGDRLKVLVRLADCVVLAVHPAQGVPQLVSTNRHVTQGGVDLEHIAWDEKACTLEATSRLVENDEYVATIYVPHEFEFIGAEADIANVRARHDTPTTVRLTMQSATSKPVRWRLKFNRAGAH